MCVYQKTSTGAIKRIITQRQLACNLRATWTAISRPRAQELLLNVSDKVCGTPILMFRALISSFDLAAVAFALERAVVSTGFRHLYMKANGSGKHICRVKQLTRKVIMCSCCQVGDAVCSQSLFRLICGATQISRYKSGMKRDTRSRCQHLQQPDLDSRRNIR
jgi:hypothetical protein